MDSSAEAEQQALVMIITVGAGLSFFASSFIVTSYIAFPVLRENQVSFLIVMLSTADMGSTAAGLLVWWTEYRAVCLIEAAGLQFFDVCSFFVSGAIALHAYFAIVRRYSYERLGQFLKYYVIVSVGTAAVCLVIPGAVGALGHQDQRGTPWCWINEQFEYLRFVCYYAPLVALWIFNVVVYIRIQRVVKNVLSFAILRANRRMTLYMLVFVVSRFAGLVHRMYEVFADGQVPFILVLLHSISSPLLGLGNSIVYGFSNKLRDELRFCVTGRRREDNNRITSGIQHAITTTEKDPLIHTLPTTRQQQQHG